MNRRKLLKNLGITIGAAVISGDTLAGIGKDRYRYSISPNPLHKSLDKPITAIVLGAGSRGNTYANYGIQFPDQLDIVGVAEPIRLRKERFAEKHSIAAENCFDTWEQVFTRPKFADAIIISTPDDVHYKPCMKALEMGYDILLEKPISPSEQECRDILKMSKKTGKIVAVCHVLRYAPYFVKMRELIKDGAIGEVVSVQHFEPIEHMHMAHSYVRGNWHNSVKTTPILLAKSCHDLDIIKWVVNKPSKQITAMGNLKWFKKENAPQNSADRCIDCKVANDCPYDAVRYYHDRRQRNYVFDLPEDKTQQGAFIMEQLKTTNYGRCVYRMENDQPDHYISNILFQDDVTASFSMEAFTSYHGRRTRIMGSMGDMVGDMNELVVTDFKTGKSITLVPKAEDVGDYKNSGHGGGDWLLVRDFVQAVGQQNPAILTSTIEESIESHLMGFMAEKSRKTSKFMAIKM
ncbi:Gfo/Idh/MocA family protein [Gynurincola endophyticus]|jgi:predicted dehydrogenase|uniref:Gfo/Idh/MocA family protein n=1 Tax=Gynurincola endophyticus TaxID=2479004 RepID=UPI000F8E1B5E|nr:Gfo/Idh/MocA family oxidoreductase [Gynurincola endophyticus]